MNYRREIDGLRALAVLPVILFHAGFKTFSGGFIGVDIFFVISGYLITTILITELNQDKFSLISFYERRARRILPILFTVMFCATPLAWILLPQYELSSFSKSLIAIPLLGANFFFWKDGGYFETATELKPLVHTWSLAVEEQYYLFFPIFLMLFWRIGRNFLLSLLILLGFLSLVIAQYGASNWPSANFFLLPSRLWELAIGSVTAFYLTNKKFNSESIFVREIFSTLGFIFIITSIFLFDEKTPVPSAHILLPTIGTTLILICALPDTLIGKVLTRKFLVLIGLISYSAYLWHQPIFAFAKYYFISINTYVSIFLTIIIFLLSLFTWRYVERPFRDKKIISSRFITISSCISSSLFIIFGYASYELSALNFDIESKTAKALTSADAVYSGNMDERKFIKFRINYEDLNPSAIVLGSSRIMQIRDRESTKKILTLGVSGASIEDYVALTDLVSKKFSPKTLYIAVDPWLFNKNSEQHRWLSLKNEYITALLNFDIRLNKEWTFSNENKESLFFGISTKIYDYINKPTYVAENDSHQLRDKIRRDGSRVYNTAYSNKTQVEISAGFSSMLNYSMANYSLSNENQMLFTHMIDHYSKKYNIILIMSPYHPKLYERMKIERPIFLEIESKFRTFAKNHNVQIVGSYNPESVGCAESEFYDGMHPKDSCMDKVINNTNAYGNPPLFKGR